MKELLYDDEEPGCELLEGNSIMAASQGWLLFQQPQKPTANSLCNLVTRQSIILPELLLDDVDVDKEFGTWCIFPSARPQDQDSSSSNNNIIINVNGPPATSCILIVLFSKGLVFSCHPNDCRWLKQSLELDGRIVQIIMAAATVNGHIYAYAYVFKKDDDDMNRVLVRITGVGNNDSDSVFIELLEPLNLGCPFQNSSPSIYGVYERWQDSLVEVCGDMYVVCTIPRQLFDMDDYDIVKAFVWVLDETNMRWTPVKTLGDDRALLLSSTHNCSSWSWATPAIEGNCIYVAGSGSKALHQYRLLDDSYTLLNSSHPHFTPSVAGHPLPWFTPPPHHSSSPITKSAVVPETDQKSRDPSFKEEEEEEEEMSLLLNHLPWDMLVLIVTEYAQLLDYINVRASCKTLRSILAKPESAQWEAWRAKCCSYPLFMSLNNSSSGICQLWDPFQNIGHTMTMPYSPDLLPRIEYCKDDWLLLQIVGGRTLECWNPFTREKLTCVPSAWTFTTCTSFGFSTCPTSPDCLTVGIHSLGGQVGIDLFRAGNKEWDKFVFDPPADDGVKFFSNYNSSAKYHDGAFYFLGTMGNLGVFKIREGEWSAHKGPLPEDTTLNSCYLAELDGQLISVFIEELGKGLRVFKFDTSNKDWVALRDLGDNMLFVSPASSFSISTKDSSMKNRVYIPKRIGDEMVFYSLDTHKYHTSSNNDSMDDFYGMKAQNFCCWL